MEGTSRCGSEGKRGGASGRRRTPGGVGAFLSGGLDSSAIVAMMSGLRSDPVQTLPHPRRPAAPAYAPPKTANISVTAPIADAATPEAVRDLDDLTFLYDEPFADASAIPTMAVSRLAAQHVKVVLSGDGDMSFGRIFYMLTIEEVYSD